MLKKTKLCSSQWTVAAIKRERNILMTLKECQWFTKLLFAKNTPNALYFGMEYYCGGDLYTFQRKFGCFKESVGQFYIAELIVAIERLHSLGIIHRDLKRENILLTIAGHIVVGDFGCSRELNDNEFAFANAGTPGYVCALLFLILVLNRSYLLGHIGLPLPSSRTKGFLKVP